MITLSGDTRDLGIFAGERLRVHVLRNRQRLRWTDAFREERLQIAQAIEHSDCEVVHAHWTYEFALAALATKKPTVVTVHDWAPQVLRYHMHVYRVVRLVMQRQTLRRATHLTAVSPYIAEKVQTRTRSLPKVIPNGIAFPVASPQRTHSDLRVVGALNSGFGRLKNVSVLLRAFSLARFDFPDLELRLAGPGYGPNGPAAAWAQHHGLADSVKFVGPLSFEEVSGFLSSLDLFVHPSREESFGMVLIEALLNGTPVVAGSDSGAVPWVLGAGRAGTLVDIRSAAEIADAIRLLTSPEARARSAGEGFNFVREKFSLSASVEAYENCYQEALFGPR
jgi:glycosyltransferase involved in cell wall biosynthesis